MNRTPQNTSQRKTGSSARTFPSRNAEPNVQRRNEKRRRALAQRIRSFDTALPALSLQTLPRPSFAGAQIGFTGFVWSKLLSLALLAATVAALIWMQSDPRWYVDRSNVTIEGTQRIRPTEVLALADVDGWNLFWLRADDVTQRILEHPWLSGAKVSVGIPRGLDIAVEEDPAIAVWVTNLGEYWVSAQGAALPVTDAPPMDMPRLVDQSMAATLPGSQPGTALDTDIVASALALIESMPGVTEVRYSEEIGLNFGLPSTTLWVYWGDGERVEDKLNAIALGRQIAAQGDRTYHVLDVRFPDRPILR